MIDLYFNSETGTASSEESGLFSILKASAALRSFETEIKAYYLDEAIPNISQFPIYRNDIGELQYLANALHVARQQDKESILYLLSRLARGNKINMRLGENDRLLTLEATNTPSELLQYVAMNKGMVLSFATNIIWERDFLTFIEKPLEIPNIWGQKDFTSITGWIKDFYMSQDTPLNNLKREYKAIVCMNCINDNDFSPSDWKIIFDKLRISREKQFRTDNDLLKYFGNTKIGPLIELVVTGEHRIFFSHNSDEIFIGGKYKKGHGNENKAQNKAAEKAISKINAYFNNK